ncbi:hypothetical protein HCJ46_17140 [Listeria booriae]|uniref:hypothetical protein n=1 Tax=Listeria booriae TaxID=1552123 RepID=UPI0016249562|nr:hypothetical protein [Listeria booriae]MBC1920479.1 hypothetical protein [Listeria booriae]
MSFDRPETNAKPKSKKAKQKTPNPLTAKPSKEPVENVRLPVSIKNKVEVLKTMGISDLDSKEYLYNTIETLADFYVEHLDKDGQERFSSRLADKNN